MSTPHDQPDPRALLEAVREFVVQDVEPELEGRMRYLMKVATNVLAIVERELELAGEHATRHAERLAGLGFETDAELARAIRSGDLDDRLQELQAQLEGMVADKLAVARPGYDRR